MNCDYVFFVLTSGPFPTGRPADAMIQSHLERCADCWRFAQALRPATDLFHEAVPPAEGRDLPGYWGDGPSHRSIATALADATARSTRKTRIATLAPTLPTTTHSQVSVRWQDVLHLLTFVGCVTALALTVAIVIR